MNGIDELRRTLDAHADDVLDVTAADRGAGIRRRIRATRQRRRAGAGLTAVVVVATATVALLPGDRGAGPDPAGPSVFGVDIPAEIDSLGFTYDYAEHVRGEERAVLDLDASDEPRLVSWGTSTDEDRVVVTVGAGGTAHVHDGADFADWTYIAAGDASQVTARASGDVALAVYTLGDERPDGLTGEGVTFRDVRAGAPLLGATIGEPGQAEVTVEPAARASEVFYATYCVGGPPNAKLHVEIATGEFISGSCSDRDVPLDPAANGGSSQAAGPGQDLTTRLYVTAGWKGPLVDSDDLRIGLGLYAAPTERTAVVGIGAPEILEEDGHRWRLVEVERSERGADGLSAAVPASGRPLTVRGFAGGTETTWSLGVDGEMSSTLIGGSGSTGGRLDSDAKVVRLVPEGGGTDRGAEWAVAFYEMAD